MIEIIFYMNLILKILLTIIILENTLKYFFKILIDEGSLKKSSPSNIYPILNRLEDSNLIASELKVKKNKKIKYFKITDEGVHVLNYMYSRFDLIHGNPQWTLLFKTMD